MKELSENQARYWQGPIALIIGCGDMGMGAARVLGRRRQLLVVDIDPQRLNDALQRLDAEGYQAAGYQCDITDQNQVEGLADKLAETDGVQVIAHVAAIGNGPWRKVFEVDLLGAHLVMQVVSPYMVRHGVAIIISSTGSYQCPIDARIESLLDNPLQENFLQDIVDAYGKEPEHLDAYFMAKQGINRLARRLAIEWGAREVRAVSLSPGLIDSTMGRTSGAQTPIYDEVTGEKRMGTREEKARQGVPLRRQGTLLEISSVIEFVASDAASFINGIDIPIDGGSLAVWRSRGITKR